MSSFHWCLKFTLIDWGFSCRPENTRQLQVLSWLALGITRLQQLFPCPCPSNRPPSTVLVPTKKSSLDLIPLSSTQKYSLTWQHGVSGIFLKKLLLRDFCRKKWKLLQHGWPRRVAALAWNLVCRDSLAKRCVPMAYHNLWEGVLATPMTATYDHTWLVGFT